MAIDGRETPPRALGGLRSVGCTITLAPSRPLCTPTIPSKPLLPPHFVRVSCSFGAEDYNLYMLRDLARSGFHTLLYAMSSSPHVGVIGMTIFMPDLDVIMFGVLSVSASRLFRHFLGSTPHGNTKDNVCMLSKHNARRCVAFPTTSCREK